MVRVRFGDFQLDLTSGELRKGETPVRLQPQPLRVLILLATRAGQLVPRDAIQKQIWAGETFVDFDQGLNYCIRKVRAALGDDAERPRYIETVPRRGYRFVGDVLPVSAPAEQRVMLAVLPFQNLTSDPEQEFFSDGLTEEMIAQLGRLNPRRLGVIARTSAMRYKRTDKSIGAISRELGVSYVLEGSVRRTAHRVRVTAQLIRASDQTHAWADSFERSAGDILRLQSEIARAIAVGIGVQLTPQEQVRLAHPRPVHPRVYEAYLKGRYFWKKRTRDALQKAVRYFNRAIELDPLHAPAYAGLADVHLTQMDFNYLSPREAFALADRVLLEALRLDHTLAESHTSLGHLRLHQFDWSSAERHFTRAIELNPAYDTAHYYYANLLVVLGRIDEAIAEANQVLALDPISPNARQNLLFILYLARRYDQAIDEASEAIELDPAYTELYYFLGRCYERLGQHGQALRAFHKVDPTAHRKSGTLLAAIGAAHARAGHRRKALEVLRQLEKRSAREYVSAYDFAVLHVALGDPGSALVHLAKAYDDRSSYLPFLNVDPRMDEIRADPRFQAIVERMRFPAAGLQV